VAASSSISNNSVQFNSLFIYVLSSTANNNNDDDDDDNNNNNNNNNITSLQLQATQKLLPRVGIDSVFIYPRTQHASLMR
jgi:hypothetical protein